MEEKTLIRHDPDGVRIIDEWRHGTAALWLQPRGGLWFNLHVYYPHGGSWEYKVLTNIYVDLTMPPGKLSAGLEHLVESRLC
jgi:hypothetical protein